MRILLVRHGESESNIDKTVNAIRPDHDIGLTEYGHKQAAACGVGLNYWIRGNVGQYSASWRIWHSPYKRAVQTAMAVSKELSSLVHDVREHVLLGEQQFGLFDGVPDEELPTRFPAEHAFYKKHEDFEGRFWARMPMGESRFDVAQRVHQAFGTFHRDADKHGVENLIIVAHGVTIRAFVMMWCHKNVAWFEKEPNPANCSARFLYQGEDCGYIIDAHPSARTPA